jgi:hypothetical protein
MGNRKNTKEGKTHRKMDGIRRSMTKHGLTEQDTGERDVVLGEGKHCRRDKPFDKNH